MTSRSKKAGADIFSAAASLGSEAQLKTNTVSEKKASRPKNLKAVPEQYFESHLKLVNSNKTTLSMTAYIIEALREKLERDGAL